MVMLINMRGTNYWVAKNYKFFMTWAQILTMPNIIVEKLANIIVKELFAVLLQSAVNYFPP